MLTGRAAVPSSSSRRSRYASMTTAPIRNSTFPTHASTTSDATRWISPMSLFSRDMMSPNRVRAWNRGDSCCRWR